MSSQPLDVDSLVWHQFLANAISGLYAAADDLRVRRHTYESKSDWFRSKTSGIPHEESVSRALADLFEYRRALQALSDPAEGEADLRHIAISCEKPRPLDPGISRRAKPTDYSIILMQESELDLRIEAKTVLNDRDVKREYLGPRGLERFENGANPYTIAAYGGMVAYVVDSDAATWSSRISTALAERIGDDRATSILLGTREYTVSMHNVPVVTPELTKEHFVNVVHFVLEVDAAPPKR